MKNVNTNNTTVTTINADAAIAIGDNTVLNATFIEIVSISNRTAEGVIQIGQLLLNYDKNVVMNLSGTDNNELEQKLLNENVMAASTISCYRTIGACAYLSKVVDKLPPFFNHMYILAKQEKQQAGFIRMKIESGDLKKTTTLATIRSWVGGAVATDGRPKVERAGRVLVRVFVDADDVEQVASALERVGEQCANLDVDYTEFDTLVKRQLAKDTDNALRSAYKVITNFAKSKVKTLKVTYNAKVAKQRFADQFGEICDFIEFTPLSLALKGAVDAADIDAILALTGSDQRMINFYK